MFKKLIALVTISCLCLGTISTAFAMDTETIDVTEIVTVSSEYEQAKELSKDFKKGKITGNKDPLIEYKEAFTERAALSEETLKGFGYSNEEIAILKDYLAGNVSFETAATRASAKLTATLKAPTHTKTKYACNYSWSWDKTPTGLQTDGVALGIAGIDSNSKYFETKKYSSTAYVNYVYTDGTTYKSETPTTSINGGTLSCKFPSYKQDSTGSRYVWAKSGYVILTVVPIVSGGSEFAAVRARGEYGHATSSGTMNITVTVNSTASITITFTVDNSSSKVVTYGTKQIIFYNDGSSDVEQ